MHCRLCTKINTVTLLRTNQTKYLQVQLGGMEFTNVNTELKFPVLQISALEVISGHLTIVSIICLF